MFRRRYFLRFLAGLLFVALLAFGGYTLLQSGISQGYALGLQAAAGEAVTPPPAAFYPAYGFAPFWGFGLARFFFGLLIFFILVRLLFLPWMFRGARWGHHGPGKWSHKHWGPPPWAEDEAYDEEPGRESPSPGEA